MAHFNGGAITITRDIIRFLTRSLRAIHRGTTGNKTRSHRYRDRREMAAGK